MKVAFVSQPFDGVIPPKQNSIGIWIYEVARRLAKTDEVAVFGNFTELDSLTVDRKIAFKSVSTRFDQRLLAAARRLPFYRSVARPAIASPFSYPAYAYRIAYYLKRRNYDIINIFNFSQFVPIIKAYNPASKVFLHMRCEWLSQLDERWIDKRIRAADQVIGCSEHITNAIKNRFPHFAEHCLTLQNGVDVNVAKCGRERRPGDSRRILFVGRISPEKGVHLLIDAFKVVSRRHPQARLDLIGSPLKLPLEYLVGLSQDGYVKALKRFYDDPSPRSYYLNLQKSIKDAGLEDRVVFHGYLPYTDMVAHYEKADILVNPSLSESFGRSLIEGMAAGLPVVASKVGGMSDIVRDGQTGFLVEPDSVAGLAEAMDTLLDNVNLCDAMGKEGRKRAVDVYSWEEVVSRLVQIYRGTGS